MNYKKNSIKALLGGFILLLVSSCGVPASTHKTTADSCNIADKKLERVIEQHLNISDKPSCSQLELLTYLSANEQGIKSLNGLEHAPNISAISLAGNQISDLGPIENIKGLKSLYMGNNLVEDLRPLAGLINLSALDLSNNKLEDLNPIRNLVNLEMLALGGNMISNLEPLKNLNKLDELHLWSNQISNISPLRSLSNLKKLVLVGNKISDISAVRGLKAIEYLDLDGNFVNDLRVLLDSPGINAGDHIDMRYNCLIVGTDAADLVNPGYDNDDVYALFGKGILVEVNPQKICAN